MSSQDNMDGELTDISSITGHKGRHSAVDVQEQLENVDADKVHKVKPDEKVLLEQVSEHKYDSVDALIREYLQNANATVIEAKEYLDDDYSPLIYIGYYPHQKQLVIMDNGMGWSRKKLDEVGVRPGKTTNAYHANRPGMFGIGRLSAFKGVGGDGTFLMHSRSRRTDEELKGFWTADAFVEQDLLDDKLEENQYGTVYTFPLKYVNIDVEEAVEKFAKCLRNPVLFVQYDETGRPKMKEEYGGTFFTKGATEESCIIYEDEYVRAVAGNGGKKDDGTPTQGFGTNDSFDAVLLDVPINLNNNVYTHGIPLNDVKLLIKKEQQFIVSGENKGKIQVKQGEYNDIAKEERHKFIKQENTSESDVTLLTPTGDRDRFQKNDAFMHWINERLLDRYTHRMVDIMTHLVESDDMVNQPDYEQISFFMSVTNMVRYNHDAATDWVSGMRLEIKSIIEHAKTIDSVSDEKIEKIESIDTELFQQINYLRQNIEYCPRHDSSIQTEYGRETITHWELFRKIDDDTTVFMCVRPVMKKAKAIWQDSEQNELVRVKSKEDYKAYEERHGWKRLSWVDDSTVDQLDISDELRNRITSNKTNRTNKNTGRDAPNRELTIHTIDSEYTSNGYRNRSVKRKKRVKQTASSIKQKLEANTKIDGMIDKLVLFPSNTDEKISDYYKWYPSNGYGFASCAVKTFDYLNECDAVTHIEELLEQSSNVQIHTPDGVQTFDEFTFSRDVIKNNLKEKEHRDEKKYNCTNIIHVVNDEHFDYFTHEEAITRVAERVRSKVVFSSRTNIEEDTKLRYGIIKYSDVDLLRLQMSEYVDVNPSYNEMHLITVLSNEGRQPSLNNVASVSTKVFDSDTELYVYARLPEWEGTNEFKTLTNISRPLSSGGKNVVDMIAESRYDKGLEPLSTHDE